MALETKQEELRRLTKEYDSILELPVDEFLKPEITERLDKLHKQILILTKEIIRSA